MPRDVEVSAILDWHLPREAWWDDVNVRKINGVIKRNEGIYTTPGFLFYDGQGDNLPPMGLGSSGSITC